VDDHGQLNPLWDKRIYKCNDKFFNFSFVYNLVLQDGQKNMIYRHAWTNGQIFCVNLESLSPTSINGYMELI